MSEKTLRLTLPTWLADALVVVMENLLAEAGFKESIKAGEVSGIETSVWQKQDAQVVITLYESETEETISLSCKGVDEGQLLRASAACLALKVFESLPLDAQKGLEAAIAELQKFASCPTL